MSLIGVYRSESRVKQMRGRTADFRPQKCGSTQWSSEAAGVQTKRRRKETKRKGNDDEAFDSNPGDDNRGAGRRTCRTGRRGGIRVAPATEEIHRGEGPANSARRGASQH